VGGGLGLREFSLGALAFGCGAGCGLLSACDWFCGRVWFGRLSFGRLLFPFAVFPILLLTVEVPPFAAGVNGRNPSLDFALSCGVGAERPSGRFALLGFGGVNGRFPAVDGPRASLGDMAGAWYAPPAALAGTADRLLKSPGFAVAAIAGRP
jgi:hypothetical protein